MTKTYILGNGGHAQEVFEQVFLRNSMITNFGGFIILKDNKAFLISDNGVTPFTYPKDSCFIIGTGNKAWKTIFITHFLKYYPEDAKTWPNVVTSTAYVSHRATIGIGNVFNCFSVINGNATIGNFNQFNTYACIHHDSTMGNYNIISPYAGIMGYCTVGDSNFFAANSTITPKVTIGNDNTISAGECVFDNMSDREFFQSGIIRKKP